MSPQNFFPVPHCAGALALALTVFASVCAGTASAQNLLSNPGFEADKAKWGLFVPGESQAQNCRFAISPKDAHSGAACAEVSSDQFARFSLTSNSPIAIKSGERYRVVAWVKAGPGAEVNEGTSGVVLRLMLRNGNSDAAGSAAIFVGLNGKVTVKPREDMKAIGAAIPKEWTKTEAVFEIPAIKEGVDSMGLGVFGWATKGTFFVDDVSVEKVSETTALSPVVSSNMASNGGGGSSATSAANEAGPGPATTEAETLASLNLDAPGMEAVKAAAQTGSMEAVKKAYLDYRRTGCPAKWRVSPADKPTQAKAQKDASGDELCAHLIRNRFYQPSLLQSQFADMGKDMNWAFNPVPKSDPSFTEEWTWCVISRMYFWEKLANAYWMTLDEKYAKEWVAQLTDFAQKCNPNTRRPGESSLWRTLDASERMYDSWPFTYSHFINSPAFTPDAQWIYLRSIGDHIQLLKTGLEKRGRYGNWVASECYGLYSIAVLFPELKDAESLRKLALDRLVEEMNCTVPPDGYEAELTPNYHYFSVSSFVGPMKLAKLNNLAVPEIFRKRLLSMYQAPVVVMDQSGNVVETNDSQPYNAANMARQGLQILGDDPMLLWASSSGKQGKALPDFTMLPYAGFYSMRGGWKPNDTFLFFRAGPTGIAHQHEDMLQVVLRAWNKTLLFDPGTYMYDHSDWRRFALGTASHNTIIVDDKWQHRGGTKPPVTQPVNNPHYTTPLFDFVSGKYDGGYQKSVYEPRTQYSPEKWLGDKDLSVSHTRRVLFLKPYYALLIDTLDGTGSHKYDAHFHIDSPSAKLDPKSQAIVSQNAPDQAQLAIYPLERTGLEAEIIQGQKEPLLGWHPHDHRPIPTARFRKTQQAPAMFATLLYPFKGSQPRMEASPLAVGNDAIWSSALKTDRENVEVIVSKDNAARNWSVTSGLVGAMQAKASGMVIRRPASSFKTLVGAWNIDAYSDKALNFTLAAPGTLVWTVQGQSLFVLNAEGDQPVQIKVAKPFVREATLAPGAWMEISKTAVKAASAPLEELKPLEQPSEASGYTTYRSKLSGKESDPAAKAIHWEARTLKLPPGLPIVEKTGATGKIVTGWDEAGTSVTAGIDLPAPGWYQVKLRYCAQGYPVRSLLIGGVAPFADAEGTTLPSTLGDSPSDGWSGVTNDWKEVVLGSDTVPGGWKIYLPGGKSEISLRNIAGGGSNLDWVELIPVSK